MQTLKIALSVAFERPRTYVLAVIGGAAMLVLLLWSGELLKHYPYGWEFHAAPEQLVSIGALSALFGLLLPLESAALVRARDAAGAVGGTAGTVFALLSVSCCAPFLIPALLSFVGFSGTTLLAFNGTMRQLAMPLTLASVLLLLVSIGLVSRTLTAACRLDPLSHLRGSNAGATG